MAINVDKAQEFNENGFAISDDNGNVQFYITTGSGAPIGAAPVNSWYFRQDLPIIYYKFGALDTDWRQVRAADLQVMDQQSQMIDLQTFLNNLGAGGGTGVSQTAIFGDGGNTSKNSYLPNQGVQSNIVGVPVGINNAKLRNIFLGNAKSRKGNVYVRERYPAGTGTWTNIYTLSLNKQKYKSQGGLDIAITAGAEISIYTKVSLKNCKVVLNINGDSAI